MLEPTTCLWVTEALGCLKELLVRSGLSFIPWPNAAFCFGAMQTLPFIASESEDRAPHFCSTEHCKRLSGLGSRESRASWLGLMVVYCRLPFTSTSLAETDVELRSYPMLVEG